MTTTGIVALIAAAWILLATLGGLILAAIIRWADTRPQPTKETTP